MIGKKFVGVVLLLLFHFLFLNPGTLKASGAEVFGGDPPDILFPLTREDIACPDLHKVEGDEHYIQVRLTDNAAGFLRELTRNNAGKSLAITLGDATLARTVIRGEAGCGRIVTSPMSGREAMALFEKIGNKACSVDIDDYGANDTPTDYNIESVWITSVEYQHKQGGSILLIQLADHFQRIMNGMRSDSPDCLIRFMFFHHRLAVMRMSEIAIAHGKIKTELLPEDLASDICRELTHPSWRISSPKHEAKSRSSADIGLIKHINYRR